MEEKEDETDKQEEGEGLVVGGGAGVCVVSVCAWSLFCVCVGELLLVFACFFVRALSCVCFMCWCSCVGFEMLWR